MKLELLDDAIIATPLDLANALGNYLLVIDDGAVAEGTTVPERILARWERDKDLLFIDSRVITWLQLEETMRVWRKSNQYAGVQPKRLAANSGQNVRPSNALCFDLLENPEERKSPIRPRRGRPLKAERVKARMAVLDTTNHEAVNILREIAAIRQDYPNDKRILNVLDRAKDILNRATELLATGRKPRAKETAPRKRANPKVPRAERIRVDALDSVIVEAMPRIHRILKKSINVEGRPKWEEKEIRPEGHPESWIGRYEDITQENGTRSQQLFLPISFLKAMDELRYEYTKDYRYVRKITKYMGAGTVYVAMFDLGRKEVDSNEDAA